MNKKYLNKITFGNCIDYIPYLESESIHLLLSDIPYGISLDDWDVLHNNKNSAHLGSSPAQKGKDGFKRRGKPINGWSKADRNIGLEYQKWCHTWSSLIYSKMKPGSFVFIFGGRRTIHRAIHAFEDSGFLLRDIIAWKKPSAHHRAQRVSIVMERRGLIEDAQKWEGWRLGNLAPIWEPIAWFIKPYAIGKTLTDNILEHEVGAMNTDNLSPTNLLEFSFKKTEERLHEAQKPINLIKYLIKLSTREGQIVIDPFMGSGTTALAALSMNRHFIGFESDRTHWTTATGRIKTVCPFI